jgi:tetraacyldisaccharide 4'-kinase
VIRQALSRVYGAAATWQRARARTRPGTVRRLDAPVISVGNLALGGTGKTPVVAAVTRMLLEWGERPAVLTRGYRRRDAPPGTTVVSDGDRLAAGVERAGDEPLALARELPGAMVLVGADRYVSGRLAERHLGATVHVLDDGFQHHALARDVDLLLVSVAEFSEGGVVPAGRLREPLDAARWADAWLVDAAGVEAIARWAAALGVTDVFGVEVEALAARSVEPFGEPVRGERGGVVAVAGIARPERFFSTLASHGWRVDVPLAFGDHHSFTARDVASIADDWRRSGARLVMTTSKDLERLLPFRPLPFPLAWLPIAARVGPGQAFDAWLRGRLAEARTAVDVRKGRA